jgi:hypothetical protein
VGVKMRGVTSTQKRRDDETSKSRDARSDDRRVNDDTKMTARGRDHKSTDADRQEKKKKKEEEATRFESAGEEGKGETETAEDKRNGRDGGGDSGEEDGGEDVEDVETRRDEGSDGNDDGGKESVAKKKDRSATLIMPVLHNCLEDVCCVHVWVPIGMSSPFKGTRVCIPTEDKRTFSGLDFQKRTGYGSLLRNRTPFGQDRKIGTRQMVPIDHTAHDRTKDKIIQLTSLRNMLFNMSDKWMRDNSRSSDWQGGQAGIDKWTQAHFTYMRKHPLKGLNRDKLSRQGTFVKGPTKQRRQRHGSENDEEYDDDDDDDNNDEEDEDRQNDGEDVPNRIAPPKMRPREIEPETQPEKQAKRDSKEGESKKKKETRTSTANMDMDVEEGRKLLDSLRIGGGGGSGDDETDENERAAYDTNNRDAVGQNKKKKTNGNGDRSDESDGSREIDEVDETSRRRRRRPNAADRGRETNVESDGGGGGSEREEDVDANESDGESEEMQKARSALMQCVGDSCAVSRSSGKREIESHKHFKSVRDKTQKETSGGGGGGGENSLRSLFDFPLTTAVVSAGSKKKGVVSSSSGGTRDTEKDVGARRMRGTSDDVMMTRGVSRDVILRSKDEGEEEEEEEEEEEVEDKPKKRGRPAGKKTAVVASYAAFRPTYAYADDVTIKMSSISGAGKGVFARCDFAKDQVIGTYVGVVVSQRELASMSPERANKVISITDAAGHLHMVDAASSTHYSAFLNHKWRESGDPLGAANVQVTDELRFKCLRDIQRGEELFIDYGIEYWVFQRIGRDIRDIEDTAKRIRIIADVFDSMPNRLPEKRSPPPPLLLPQTATPENDSTHTKPKSRSTAISKPDLAHSSSSSSTSSKHLSSTSTSHTSVTRPKPKRD